MSSEYIPILKDSFPQRRKEESRLQPSLVTPLQPCAFFAPLRLCRKIHLKFQHTGLMDCAKSAPTVLVVPADRHIRRAQLAPPCFKLFTRNVKRSRRHEVIEHNQMLLPPTKGRDRTQVIVVKKILAQRRTPPIEWSIDQLRRQKDSNRGNFRQVQERTLIDARRDFFTHRIHQADYPLVVLRSVDPCRHMPARFHLRSQRKEPLPRVGKMMKHTN